MIDAREILAGAQLQDQYRYLSDDASVNERLGFLTMQAPFTSPRQEIIIGFGVPGWQTGNDDLPETATSITEFDDLPESQRTLASVHMGVGIRLYNTWQAATLAPERFQRIGAYMLGWEIGKISTPIMREGKGQRFDMVIQTGIARLAGLKTLVRNVHWWQEGKEGADVSIHSQRALIADEQRSHRQTPLAGIEEKILVVRNPQLVLTKVGEVDVAQAST